MKSLNNVSNNEPSIQGRARDQSSAIKTVPFGKCIFQAEDARVEVIYLLEQLDSFLGAQFLGRSWALLVENVACYECLIASCRLHMWDLSLLTVCFLTITYYHEESRVQFGLSHNPAKADLITARI